jgi:hypothetical protein
MMTKNNLSLGNKIIGVISFSFVVIVVIIGSILSFMYNEVFLLIISVISFTGYLFQAMFITYIYLQNEKLYIENIFTTLSIKPLKYFETVSEIGFGNLMKIKFTDGSSYYFYGKSKKHIDKYLIKRKQR